MIICCFFRRSRANNSEVSGGILMKFELIRAFIIVLVTCKIEEDPIKNEGARVLTSLLLDFFRRSWAANSEVSGGILPKFELIQAFIVVLVYCKNEKDPIKNEKRDNKQCLLDTPRRVTVNNKRLLSKCKKLEKKCAYLQKPWHY